MPELHDDDLAVFAASGAPALPEGLAPGHIDRDGARLWHATVGDGPPVVLLHGGLGHSGNWGHQVPALVAAGRKVVLIDTRGHGRSTRDGRPFHYAQLAADLRAVLDALAIERAPLVGWSDGACTALLLAREAPERVASVFFFGCNMHPDGARPFVPTPEIDRVFSRHAKDYADLSATPEAFQPLVDDVSRMQASEPVWGDADLADVRVPVTVVHAERDEFIHRAHAEHLAERIPGAGFVLLPEVSHFAPLQRPGGFTSAILDSLAR